MQPVVPDLPVAFETGIELGIASELGFLGVGQAPFATLFLLRRESLRLLALATPLSWGLGGLFWGGGDGFAGRYRFGALGGSLFYVGHGTNYPA
jgi:hypothetical protein